MGPLFCHHCVYFRLCIDASFRSIFFGFKITVNNILPPALGLSPSFRDRPEESGTSEPVRIRTSAKILNIFAKHPINIFRTTGNSPLEFD